jgi:hypothetical protein
MQKDLANYLGEAHDVDGEWTIEEKKRMINKGCVAVATKTLTVHKNCEWTVEGTTANPVKTLIVPDRVLKPKRLFINGNEYVQLELDDFLSRLGNFVDIPEGSQLSSSSTNITQIQQLNRFFYHNEGSNTFDINPPITDKQKIMLYMISVPDILTKDGEIPNLHPSFAYLAPVWAAKMMLDKDEEQRDRGASAHSRWREGMDDIERFKHRSAGNKVVTMKKDPSRFQTPNVLSNDYDYGTTFDRFP